MEVKLSVEISFCYALLHCDVEHQLAAVRSSDPFGVCHLSCSEKSQLRKDCYNNYMLLIGDSEHLLPFALARLQQGLRLCVIDVAAGSGTVDAQLSIGTFFEKCFHTAYSAQNALADKLVTYG